MKARRTIPENPKGPEAQANPLLSDRAYDDLDLIKRLLPFVGVGPAPSAMDCEDMSRSIYRTLKGLLMMQQSAVIGDQEMGDANPDFIMAGIDGIEFHVQVLRLVAQYLFNLFPDDPFASK